MATRGFDVDFSWNLYRRVAGGNDNVIISPHSVTAALMLAALGAKGETEEQVRNVIGLGDQSAADAQTAFSKLSQSLKSKSDADAEALIVTIANKLFARNGLTIVEKFAKESSDLYGSGIEAVDFVGKPNECRVAINTWVEENTMQKIKEIVPDGMITAATKLVLANAIYFKGKWDKLFKTEKTEKMNFYTSPGNTVNVDMMREKYDMPHVTDDDLNFAAISIPYQNRTMSMIIIRPNEVDGLGGIEERLTAKKLSETLGQLHMKAKVDLGLPKFTFTKSSDLTRVLPALGITHLFDPASVDLSGMVAGEKIAFTDVLHKAYIEVNEEGTEAAASTVMISRMIMMRTQEVSFICDRPFLFILIDNETQTILFIGRYMSPA